MVAAVPPLRHKSPGSGGFSQRRWVGGGCLQPEGELSGENDLLMHFALSFEILRELRWEFLG